MAVITITIRDTEEGVTYASECYPPVADGMLFDDATPAQQLAYSMQSMVDAMKAGISDMAELIERATDAPRILVPGR